MMDKPTHALPDTPVTLLQVGSVILERATEYHGSGKYIYGVLCGKECIGAYWELPYALGIFAGKLLELKMVDKETELKIKMFKQANKF